MPLWVNKLHSGGEVVGLGMEVRENTAKTNKRIVSIKSENALQKIKQPT